MKTKRFLNASLAVMVLMAFGLTCMSFTTDGKPASRVVEEGGTGPHKAIMKDHRKALRVNGVWSCYLLLALRYLYKMTELIASKFVRISSLPKYIKC